MKKLFITSFALAAAIISSFSFSSQKSDEPKAKINWVTIEQAEKLNKQKPKKIMIDLYTSWCGYCKQLDAVTFEDPKVIAYIN